MYTEKNIFDKKPLPPPPTGKYFFCNIDTYTCILTSIVPNIDSKYIFIKNIIKTRFYTKNDLDKFIGSTSQINFT